MSHNNHQSKRDEIVQKAKWYASEGFEVRDSTGFQEGERAKFQSYYEPYTWIVRPDDLSLEEIERIIEHE